MNTKSMSIIMLLMCWAFIVFVRAQTPQEKATTQEIVSSDSTRILEKKVAALFKNSCATAGCHQGKFPKKKLNLETDKFTNALIDVPSLQVDSLKLVDTKTPRKSYLLLKIKGEKGIVGDPMPIDAPLFNREAIHTVESWIRSLSMKKDEKLPAK